MSSRIRVELDLPRSPYAVLNEVRRVLKTGGVLVFSVPNLRRY